MKSADVMDPSKFPNDKLRKIREVVTRLQSNCKLAWDVEPNFAPDESHLRLSSRYCTFSQYLACKPIKNGLTIYCLNFCRTNYLYCFEVFTGKEEEHGCGMPTDTEALNEDSAEYMGYMYPMVSERLIGSEFDNTGAMA